MAKKQHKERIQQPKESQIARTLMKLFFSSVLSSSASSCLTTCLSTGFLGVYVMDYLSISYGICSYQ